jgi:hypothetical protein
MWYEDRDHCENSLYLNLKVLFLPLIFGYRR